MNPMPAPRMQRPTPSGSRSMLTPSAASTSAAPEREESARLPCLATGTPAPATMKAAQVEMLNEPEASPPVPTMSTASAGASTRSILSRMAVTAPVISSTVSPRTRKAISRPPICEGVASPDIMVSNPRAASSRVSAVPVAALAITPLSASVTPPSHRCSPPLQDFPLRPAAARVLPGRDIPGAGDREEVPQDQMAVLGGDAFRMELNAVDGKCPMGEPHDQPVTRFGVDCELWRQPCAFDHQGMVARGFERTIDSTKDAITLVMDFRELAVHQDRRTHDLAAEGLADGLVTQAHAQDGNGSGRLGDQLQADSGL